MKNHQMVDGRLLQTNKKFSALKERQKMRIAEWTYEAYKDCYVNSGKVPNKSKESVILNYVFNKIEEAGIWIPDGEIYKYYHSRRSRLQKRLQKEFAEEFISEIEKMA